MEEGRKHGEDPVSPGAPEDVEHRAPPVEGEPGFVGSEARSEGVEFDWPEDWGDYTFNTSWFRRSLELPLAEDSNEEQSPSSSSIADFAEWRRYRENTKGIPRSNTRPTPFINVNLERVTGRSRPKGYRVPKVDFVSGLYNHREIKHMTALAMARTATNILGIHNNMVIANIVSFIINRYFDEKKRRAEQINRREVAALVAAAIEEAVTLARAPLVTRDIYETVLDISKLPSPMDLEAFKRTVWNVKRKLSEWGVLTTLRRNFAERFGRQKQLLSRINTFIYRIVNTMNLPPQKKRSLAKAAKKLVETTVKNGKSLYGKPAEAVAAASVYLVARAMDIDVDQKSIAKLANITETNIRKAFRFLVEDQAIIIPVRLVWAPPHSPSGQPGI